MTHTHSIEDCRRVVELSEKLAALKSAKRGIERDGHEWLGVAVKTHCFYSSRATYRELIPLTRSRVMAMYEDEIASVVAELKMYGIEEA